ncbi:hypothetical protein [Nocardiopsis synnemataformans]|uniref:hypothetical protein n=1 Tax=Nocardiopsis synnemataformans TaxID=61305 RepID=UPI003EBE0228
MSDRPHARAFELPGWPCPPLSYQIADYPGSYGWVGPSHVYIDEAGYLWVSSNSDLTPAPQTAFSVCLAWTEDGIGLWAPKKAYSSFITRKCLGEGFTPIARIIPEPPTAEQS